MIGVGIMNSARAASENPVEAKGKGLRLGGIALALTMFGASGALAQNCDIPNLANFTNLSPIASVPAGAASAVAGSLGNISTAFLTQQTSAFVAGAQSTEPNQASGGVWVRTVGGEVEIKSRTSVHVVVTPQGGGPVIGTAQGPCISRVKQDFVGVQAGFDLARLDVNGWNLHWGLTAGYLEAKGEDIPLGTFESSFRGSLRRWLCGRDVSEILCRRDGTPGILQRDAERTHSHFA